MFYKTNTRFYTQECKVECFLFGITEYMPVTHGVTGSSPVRTAINIENQCFTKQTPDFTPKNVKSGVLYLELPDFIFARIVVISTQPQGFPNNLLIP